MSTIRANNLEPQSGDTIRVRGRFVFDDPQPGSQLASVNDIGTPGTQGFGVGICPNLPAGFAALSGALDPASPNYGNYVYSDGSIMCWVPAFFYKWGTGANGLPVNDVDVVGFHAFASVAAANAAGYALHRAFYDGGAIKAGFFVDKFHCSNNSGVASSIRLGDPLSTNASNNPISNLVGGPANNYGGTFAAAKTRGADFFVMSRFITSALAMLSLAHGQAAAGIAFCAWYDAGGTTSFPKGNNDGLALRDVNDTLLTFAGTGYTSGSFAPAYAGSGSVFAKTAHNGQDCGVADLNGNLWHVTPGLTYGTNTATDTGYFVLSTDVAMKDLTGGNSVDTDAFGVDGLDANYDFAGSSYGYASDSGGARPHRFGNATSQVLSEAVSGMNWQMAGLGLPLATGASAGGTSKFGADYMYDEGPSNNELCPLSGGSAFAGSVAGVWALYLIDVRSASGGPVGFRAGLYV